MVSIGLEGVMGRAGRGIRGVSIALDEAFGNTGAIANARAGVQKHLCAVAFGEALTERMNVPPPPTDFARPSDLHTSTAGDVVPTAIDLRDHQGNLVDVH